MNPPITERRKSERLGLRLQARFLSDGDDSPALNCFTENISSRGFYCICPEPMIPGERRDVHLMLPGLRFGSAEAAIKCNVRVVRID